MPVCRHSSSRTQWTGHRDGGVSPFGASSCPSSFILGSPASHYGADATVFGLGSASSWTRLLAVVLWNVLGVLRVMGMLAVVAVLWVRGVGRVLVELREGGRVVVVVVVVGRWVLRDLAVVGMVTVVLGLHWVCDLCCVVQVGRVGLVGYEGGVAGRGQRRVALRRRFPSLAAKKRPQDGCWCRVWDGGGAAWGALVWRSGSSARVGTANDGPLEVGKRGNSMSVRAAKATAARHHFVYFR